MRCFTRARFHLTLFLAALTWGSLSPVSADWTLYGSVGDYLVRVNPSTARATVVAEFAFPLGVESISRMAFDSNSQTLYGLQSISPTGPPILVTVNLCTAGVNLAAALSASGLVFFSEELAVDPASVPYLSVSLDGNTQGDFRSETLATVNPVAGSATVVALFSGSVQNEADSLEFAGSTLWSLDAIGTSQTNIHTVDPTSGKATLVNTSILESGLLGVAFNPDSGLLYGTPGGRNLGVIDQTTGAVTVIGQMHAAGEFGGAIMAAARRGANISSHQ